MITLLTIISFPLFGWFCFKQGRELQKTEDEAKLDDIIKKLKDQPYEKRSNN